MNQTWIKNQLEIDQNQVPGPSGDFFLGQISEKSQEKLAFLFFRGGPGANLDEIRVPQGRPKSTKMQPESEKSMFRRPRLAGVDFCINLLPFFNRFTLFFIIFGGNCQPNFYRFR